MESPRSAAARAAPRTRRSRPSTLYVVATKTFLRARGTSTIVLVPSNARPSCCSRARAPQMLTWLSSSLLLRVSWLSFFPCQVDLTSRAPRRARRQVLALFVFNLVGLFCLCCGPKKLYVSFTKFEETSNEFDEFAEVLAHHGLQPRVARLLRRAACHAARQRARAAARVLPVLHFFDLEENCARTRTTSPTAPSSTTTRTPTPTRTTR